MTLDPEGRRCGAATTAVSRRTRRARHRPRAVEALGSGAESASSTWWGSFHVTATVYDAAHEDDALALEVVRDTARYLGAGVANLINVFNRRPSSFAAESPSQASA